MRVRHSEDGKAGVRTLIRARAENLLKKDYRLTVDSPLILKNQAGLSLASRSNEKASDSLSSCCANFITDLLKLTCSSVNAKSNGHRTSYVKDSSF